MESTIKKIIPRLPLDGKIDLTYRCNNTCRHCWLWLPTKATEIQEELSFEEIRRIVDQARAMGCQSWAISGGEPMLRPDFTEIFDYITQKSVSYKLNTNGTLITPEIARLLTRKGNKMVALYGATADVHDQITRTPGSFEETLRGFAYLKEAGAGFTVQVIPMRGNIHQYQQMIDLAQSLSPYHRIGSPWLWLSACNSDRRNQMIAGERLSPERVIQLDEPPPPVDLLIEPEDIDREFDSFTTGKYQYPDNLFSTCIESRRDFHIDPYGQMSFCYFIKDPALRYDLRKGTFQQAWDEFIPSLKEKVHGGEEYRENCGSCDLRGDCKWCAVYGYLEHGRYSAKVEYLCRVAEESRRFKDEWKVSKMRLYQLAGVTLQVTTDFPIAEDTFSPVFEPFRVDEPGNDTVSIRLRTADLKSLELRLGTEIYRRPPWAIYQQRKTWIYQGIIGKTSKRGPHVVAIANQDYSRITIVHNSEFYSKKKNYNSLTTFSSDQILLAHVLVHRQAFYLHSSGIILDEKGFLFVGHSGAGKSTMLKMLRENGEILCDDRNIIRRWPEGFRVHGTWSHGELPDVSPASAPLRAILLLEKAKTNELIPITKDLEKIGIVLSHVVRPLLTKEWWEKIMSLAETLISEVPMYRLRFDKSGKVIDTLKQLY